MNYHRTDIGDHIETLFRATQEQLREDHIHDLRKAQFDARRTNNSAGFLPAEAESYIRHIRALTVARAQTVAEAYSVFQLPSGEPGIRDLVHFYNTTLVCCP